ncbi:MAG: flagellar export protein FliJ [Treponema sp.]|nr:flagellar export protein FliJ [Treponema sp.]
MRRFSFRLQKILELRKHREQEAKTELGRAIGILTKIENDIAINSTKHSLAVKERFTGINASDETGVSSGAVSMLSWDTYILRLEQEAERLAEDAACAEQVVEEKRELYLEASRDLKVMEKLREKREKEHRKEMFVAETKERDDKVRSKG